MRKAVGLEHGRKGETVGLWAGVAVVDSNGALLGSSDESSKGSCEVYSMAKHSARLIKAVKAPPRDPLMRTMILAHPIERMKAPLRTRDLVVV